LAQEASASCCSPLTRINSVSLLLVKAASLLQKAKSIPRASSPSDPEPGWGLQDPTQRLRLTLAAGSAVTSSRLTNNTYHRDQEATDWDLEDGEQQAPSSSQKGFKGCASYPLRRGSARQGGLQEAKVSCCQHIPPCPPPTTPRAQDVLTRHAESPPVATEPGAKQPGWWEVLARSTLLSPDPSTDHMVSGA